MRCDNISVHFIFNADIYFDKENLLSYCANSKWLVTALHKYLYLTINYCSFLNVSMSEIVFLRIEIILRILY